MTDHSVSTRDGRTLAVIERGDAAGVPVLRHHGTPGSARISDEEAARAETHGVRLIGYDRPGYGGSTRLEGRNVADCAADVRAIADALGIRRLGVMGGSGGGPHTLACGALLDGLVPAVAPMSSPAPFQAPGLDWLAGQGEANVQEIAAVRESPEAGRRFMTGEAAELAGTDPEAMRSVLATLLPPVDAEALTGQLARDQLASFGRGLEPGVDGWLDDDLAFLSDWGFGLSQIRVPVLLLQGRVDKMVPVAHGEWLAAAVPGVDARILDDEGHISIRSRSGEVLDWLVEHVR